MATGARRARLLAIAVVALLLGGVGGYLVGHRGTDKTESPTPPSGIVDVTISGLNVPAQSELAALLYRGAPSDAGLLRHGVGGFMAPVSPNVYRVTEVVRAGPPLIERVTVSRPIAQLPAGAYTLWVVIARHVAPYNEWVPAGPLQFGCTVQVTVNTASVTRVHVTEVQPWSQSNSGRPAWMVADCPLAVG